MGLYTIKIRELLEDEKFKLFNFDYPFYNEEFKPVFEDLFIETFFDSEIGFETVLLFKQRLRAKLKLIYPKYKQLYETELACKDINFLLNKDLTETFERELVGNMINKGDVNSVDTSVNNFKESNLADGISSLELKEGYLTDISKTDTTNNTNVKNSTSTDNTSKETTKLVSQGNIGITSSAELLEKWRDVLININEMIIDECRCLFMRVF